jgi:hypothetical protein
VRQSGVDLSIYFKAVVVVLRNPAIVAGPLIASSIAAVLGLMIPTMATGPLGGLNGGIAQLLVQLLFSVGLAFGIIAADLAIRRGRASFGETWSDGERRLGDILMAALGLNFVVWVAVIVGGFLTPIGGLILGAVALFFFIYTMPAAAIGGIPGGAALQVSVERSRANPLPTIGVFIAYLLVFFFLTGALETQTFDFLITLGVAVSTIVTLAIHALIQAVCSAYVATVMAKTYSDIAYGRRWY